MELHCATSVVSSVRLCTQLELHYRELAPPIRRGLSRQGGGNGKRSVHKLPNAPSSVCHAGAVP